MKKKKLFLSSALFLALSMSITACGGKKTEEKQTKMEETVNYKSANGNKMVLTLFQNPKTLDIQKTAADYFIPLQIYSRLVDVKVNKDGSKEIVPSLAEKWDISEDAIQAVIIVSLRISVILMLRMAEINIADRITRSLSGTGRSSRDGYFMDR